MPAAPSSPVPAVLAKLGHLRQHDTGRLRAHLQRVPDPRSRRGRRYPLVGLLLVRACAVVSGARTITEVTEWGQRATTTVLELLGLRRPPPGRRRAPSHATLTRLLAALDGDAPDAATGATWPNATTPTSVAPARRRGGRLRWTARHCPAPRTNSSATGTCCPPSPTPPQSQRFGRESLVRDEQEPERAATRPASTSSIADSTSRPPSFADASAHMIGIPVGVQTR
ncbi:transposase family protein [Streptomyces sp. NPDC020898]|uniref:transposase family protein n=1 Tax=Streptomyces sp. NPDC020898 TaxID=3365101 RepID=UPI0037B7BCF5